MEEFQKIQKKKSNKGLIVLVVLLFVVILGLVGYICYDKGVFDSLLGKDSPEPKQKEKISEEEVNSLRDFLIVDESSGMQTSLYFDHNVSIDTMSDELVNYLIKVYGDKNQLSDKIQSWMREHNNDIGSGDTIISSFAKQELENILKLTFNIDKDIEVKESSDYIYQYNSNGVKYHSNSGVFDLVSSINPDEPGTVKTKMTKYEQSNNDVYIYEKVMLCNYGQTYQSSRCLTPYNAQNPSVLITDDSKIMNSTGDTREFNYDYIFEKYGDRFGTYKTTFKKGIDGKYYWYSSEIVNE